jgi:putative DNA primase/helicase
MPLAGILNWALDGLCRLTVANGNRFTRLPSAEESIAQMRDLASPIGAFVREECDVQAGYEIEVDMLYSAFKVWAENNGHTKSSKQVFGRDLHAAVPSLRKPQQRGTENAGAFILESASSPPARRIPSRRIPATWPQNHELLAL